MIKGKSVDLRVIMEDDINEIFTLTSDLQERGNYWPYNLSSYPQYKKRFNENGFWTDDFGTLLIVNKQGRRVGEITYFKGLWYMPGYEIGYQIYRKEDRGKGYGSEALNLFVDYLFKAKPIQRLEIEVIVDNIGSRKVAEKCGFQLEGLKRKASFSRGVYHDVELLSLIREDWQSSFVDQINTNK
ncbi:GNAT family N-acetyltransferase [Haloplasma contractile]|uniref:Acetyltransferase GNAT family protein n=1 Tax=Haloplasma contractile SSD-17B TaxID=1033810 RepID=U2FQG7_9MOLU|nr:GNAT family protein [Haloplasma contractile]ERJ13274.1 Acetyltransferase GNAT family protein [Haloplasma contractile SSD-17B]